MKLSAFTRATLVDLALPAGSKDEILDSARLAVNPDRARPLTAPVEAGFEVRSMGLKATDYMTTDVVVVSRAANVAEIAALLKKHRITGVPVVDEEKRLLGLVTHEELINIFNLTTSRCSMSWRFLMTSVRSKPSLWRRSSRRCFLPRTSWRPI